MGCFELEMGRGGKCVAGLFFYQFFLYLYLKMSLIKSRNWTKKEDEDLLTVLEQSKRSNKEATWNQIAEMIKQRNPTSRKTGKQCRERWANQLNPDIKRNENWSAEENQILFRLHLELGNRWSEICNNIPGRTDNCVKNHFYSTMRRGLRKINSYIENIKRRSTLAKIFKNQILNKILAICQGKKDSKYQFTKTAKQLALSIKTSLIKLALQLSDIDDENPEFKEALFQDICEFSRNCRKRKAKKSSDLSQNSFQYEREPSRREKQIQIGERMSGAVGIRQKIEGIEMDESEGQQAEQEIQTLGLNQQKNPQNEPNQSLGLLPKKQKNIFLEQSSNLQKSYQINPFSFIIQSMSNYESLMNLNKKNDEGPLKSSQKGEFRFLNTVPDMSKKPEEKEREKEKFKKNQSGVIDLMNPQGEFGIESQNLSEKVSTIFPDIIKSQQLQQSLNFNFPFSGKDSSHFSPSPMNFDSNLNISFSPGISPFTFCTMQQGFNYFPGWAVASQEKFRSTTLEFSNSNLAEKDKEEAERDRGERKSSFRAVRPEREDQGRVEE